MPVILNNSFMVTWLHYKNIPIYSMNSDYCLETKKTKNKNKKQKNKNKNSNIQMR